LKLDLADAISVALIALVLLALALRPLVRRRAASPPTLRTGPNRRVRLPDTAPGRVPDP